MENKSHIDENVALLEQLLSERRSHRVYLNEKKGDSSEKEQKKKRKKIVKETHRPSEL